MVRLHPRQRAALGETLRELANLFAAALVIGQVALATELYWLTVLTGISVWAALVVIAIYLEG